MSVCLNLFSFHLTVWQKWDRYKILLTLQTILNSILLSQLFSLQFMSVYCVGACVHVCVCVCVCLCVLRNLEGQSQGFDHARNEQGFYYSTINNLSSHLILLEI